MSRFTNTDAHTSDVSQTNYGEGSNGSATSNDSYTSAAHAAASFVLYHVETYDQNVDGAYKNITDFDLNGGSSGCYTFSEVGASDDGSGHTDAYTHDATFVESTSVAIAGSLKTSDCRFRSSVMCGLMTRRLSSTQARKPRARRLTHA